MSLKSRQNASTAIRTWLAPGLADLHRLDLERVGRVRPAG